MLNNFQLNHPGYNIEENIENRDVIRSIAVELPSVKKQFRQDEQRRMQSIRAPTRDDEPRSSRSVPSTNTNVSTNIHRIERVHQVIVLLFN